MANVLGQSVDNALPIWPKVHADIIALESANKCFSHAIQVKTTYRGRTRDQCNAPSEGAHGASGVAAVVIDKPFDRFGYAVRLSVALLEGGNE